MVRADADWLALREPADAAARSLELVDQLLRSLPAGRVLRLHDLGGGTGSVVRWLAPRLPGPQHWVLHDRDPELLARAASYPPPAAADGSTVVVETREDDVSRLAPTAVADADLLTASALLDMMDGPELDRFVAGCALPGCPVLITLSVVGRVTLAPPHPWDAVVTDAFNAHQRRTVGSRTLLGPDASSAAATRFRAAGRDVRVRSSPWRLGGDQRALTADWLTGWVAAAVEQQPDLQDALGPYHRRRLAQAASGDLSVTVHHEDLLVRPLERRR
ncbi:hypothetical protein [Nocardioides sp. GXQ0305]|uniref:hypothetical protein n=1 Tax=Nocardioides sp. GXQ0305 TaxID=3423912 RepID=UPI003D7E6645